MMLADTNTRFLLRTELNVLRERGLGHFARWNAMLTSACVQERLRRHRYRELSEGAMQARRRSETVFVLGSGYSLNDLDSREWAAIGQHDVFGFNASYYQRWVRTDFHLLRGGVYGELEWRQYAGVVSRAIQDNPLYAATVFLLQGGFLAQFCNQLVGHALLPPGAAIFRYFTARGDGPPGRTFADGIRHTGGTLTDVVNCAFCLGWRHIVLAGIDLYDSRYFWLPPDQTPNLDKVTGAMSAERNAVRGTRYDDTHHVVRLGILDVMRSWRDLLAQSGCTLSVYNPRSLLADVVPVYSRPHA